MEFQYLPHPDSDQPDRDLSPTRKYKLDNGNTVIIERTDPYGLWYMRFEKGQMPTNLKDAAFTSAIQAELALKQYVQKNDKQVVSKQD